MKTILKQDLREGARYSQALYIEDQVFLPAGVAVMAKDIAMLEKLGVGEVLTEGSRVDESAAAADFAAPGMDAPFVAAEMETAAGGKNRVFTRLNEEIRLLDSVFTYIAQHKGIKTRTLWAITATLLQLIKMNRGACVEFILGNTVKDFQLAKSSVNTAILTALIAEILGVHERIIPEYVSGALLHDAGMLRVPQEVLNKKTPLSNDEKLLIQNHTIQSFHITQNELRYPARVNAIVLQHHERWDGLGYPKRLSGANIDKGACILAVADAFEAMVCAKPYRNSKTAYQAMRTMMSENSSQFSPQALQAFVKLMGIYPAGSLVLLNSGARARVQSANNGAPLRPVVKIIASGQSTPPAVGEVVDLLGDKSLYIVTSCDDSGGA